MFVLHGIQWFPSSLGLSDGCLNSLNPGYLFLGEVFQESLCFFSKVVLKFHLSQEIILLMFLSLHVYKIK